MGMNINDSGRENEIHCETRVIADSSCQPCKVNGRSGSVVVRLPVVISKSKISMNIQAKLKFDRTIAGIRDIRRELQLTGCRLLDLGTGRAGKLFLDGCIVERIEYVDAGCETGFEFSGVVRFLTLKLPFECNARVEYFQVPSIKPNKGFLPLKSKQDQDRVTSEMYFELENYEINASNSVNGRIDDHGFFSETEECIVAAVTILILQEQLVNIY